MLRRIILTVLILLLMVSIAQSASFKVTDIQLEGNDRVEGITVRAVITVRPNREITLEDIDRDVQAIFKLGYFDDVSVDLRENSEGKVLVFIVHERPLIREVRFSGAKKLTEEKLRPLVTLLTPEIYDPLKVRQSIAALEESYRVEGYHAVKITPELKTDERNESLLTFKIVEGVKVLIDEIAFEGNHAITTKELTKVMVTKKRWIWSWITGRGTYKADQIQYDLNLMSALYYDRGYMDAKIKQPQMTMIDNGEHMKLLIEVDEGPQYTVGTLNIAGELIKPRKDLDALLTLKTGDVFSRAQLRKSVIRLTDLYADQGYANANVIPFTDKNAEELTIDLNLRIEKGALIHIEKINIHGNTITRDKVIRRELSLIEGDLYSATKIKTSRNRLRNLDFFEEINVSTEEGSSNDKNVLDVGVTEKPTGSFTIGAGYSSVDQLIAQGSISQANFMGYGLKLNASATLGGASQYYSIGVTDPYFLDTRWTAGFNLYKTDRDWTDFSEKATGGSTRIGHPVGRYSRVYLSYRYEEKDIYNIPSYVSSTSIFRDEEGLSTLSSLTASLTRNTTDFRLDPSRGGSTSFYVEYAGIGGTSKFAKLEFSHRQFYSLFWHTVLSINGDISYVTKTGNTRIPISEKFFLGGLRSVRGFNTRELGPKDGNLFIGGEKAAFFNLEFIFPISKEFKLKGLFFIDSGNAWRESDVYFSDMRYSAGYGVRWVSPMGPLRFEWGYNLDPRGTEKDSVFEFSIGSFF
ncbi:MAG: outer membrane protein assembly factor BamA [Geopsychrobacter sp.]|nr:outer membrane protein assembly factor BamA [Geopsychrobacter sp.]